MRRVVDIGTTRFTRVVAIDEPGAGGANHQYQVEQVLQDEPMSVLHSIKFAEGPFLEGHRPTSGLFNEDLLAMVLDRLQAFQAGDYRTRENAIAITKIEEAMLWLKKRTDDRARRGVLGTATP